MWQDLTMSKTLMENLHWMDDHENLICWFLWVPC